MEKQYHRTTINVHWRWRSPNISYKKLSYCWQATQCICAVRNGLAKTIKTHPYLYVLPCRIWSFWVKRRGPKYGKDR